MHDDPNESLSADELVLKIQKGEVDPSCLSKDVCLKIVRHLRSDIEGRWTFPKIANLIGVDPRTAKRYWKIVKQRHSVIVDDESIKAKMAEETFDCKRLSDRLTRASYSSGLSEGAKARIISLALGAKMRAIDQLWKQYYDPDRLAEKAKAEMKAKEEAKRKKDESGAGLSGKMEEAIGSLAPIERETLRKDIERMVIVEMSCCFEQKDFSRNDQIQELIDLVKKDNFGITLDESCSPIEQLNSVLRAPDFSKICLERKIIDRNRLDRVTHDKWNSLVDRVLKDIVGKEYGQLSIRERSDLMEFNRLTLEKIYQGKCPKSKPC